MDAKKDEDLDPNEVAETLTKLLKSGKRELGRSLELLNKSINKDVVVKALRNQLKSLTGMNKDLEAQADSQEKKVASLTETLESTSESLAELRGSFKADVQAAKEAAGAKVTKAKAKLEEHKTLLEEQKTKLEEQETQLKQVGTENETLEQNNSKLLEEKDDLNDQLRPALERQIALEREMGEALQGLQSCEAQLNTSNAQITELEAENKQIARQIRALKLEAAGLQDTTKAREQAILTLEEELDKLRSAQQAA